MAPSTPDPADEARRGEARGPRHPDAPPGRSWWALALPGLRLVRCQRTGRLRGIEASPWLRRLAWPAVGLAALVWFVVRVLPRPSRAAYPCQRVAAPLAAGFLGWAAAGAASVGAWIRLRAWGVAPSRMRGAAGGLALCALLSGATCEGEPGDTPSPLHPWIGEGRGLHPGRVVWAWDPDATDWAGTDSDGEDIGGGLWWQPEHTDQARVSQMMTDAVIALAGAQTADAALDALFRSFNRAHGRGDRGYEAGERIAIKVNLSTANARLGYVDEAGDLTQHPGWVNTSPQAIHALLDLLVHHAGVPQADLTVGDTTADLPNPYLDPLIADFPAVHYLSASAFGGREAAQSSQGTASEAPIHWSAGVPDGARVDYVPVSFAEATYVINLACLKGHGAGVTLTAKNHYGSLIRYPDDGRYLDLHQSLPMRDFTPGTGHYRAMVDLIAHPQLGGKTLLFLIDGLYGGYYWQGRPTPWQMPPFNGDWPSSLFVSQDPVAIDSVGYDFLAAEWPQIVFNEGAEGGVEDYLHEAALAAAPPSGTVYDPARTGAPPESLGVHEHWDDPVNKRYSGDRGLLGGIELISLGPGE